ncbi:MAG: hypothetical protein H6959_00695 [Chromatiaceae bacterium]|nr:hypothetical protein [Gammaproteobacteria bacterium]MCP5301118.1 hypothetical protein [Chromatiaceae bacterium]MCP5421410.1 hypothetical protein [Chromatiaceae bacterium]
MSRPSQFDAIQALRAQRVQADRDLAAATVAVEQAKRERDRLVTRGADKGLIDKAAKAFTQATNLYTAARGARLALVDQLAAESAKAAANLQQALTLFESLEGDLPIALLPVRLETRYTANTLQIRIYPDAINIQAHTEGLTETEQKAAQAYWEAVWNARPPRNTDEADPGFETDEQYRMRQQRPEALWAEMVKALRAPRASFIVRVMRPANAVLLDEPGIPPAPPSFPVDVATGSRLSAQPIAAMLPDRFCAVGYAPNGKIAFRRFGSVVPDVLAMSPVVAPGDPVPPEQAESPFSGESAWLSDFAEAEKFGMGITIRKADISLAGYDLNSGLSRLVVVGIDWTLGPDDSAAGIGALLEANGASGGIGFLPIGTPTNNTRAQGAGHSPAFERDPTQNAAPPPSPPPGTRAIDALRTAFGIRAADFDSEHIGNAELDETDLSGHMINTLYRGMAGNYIEEYWTRADDDGASEDTLSNIRDHVVGYVRPAGPLQPIRVANQPYGILPVVAADRYQPDPGFEQGLNDLLTLLRPSWENNVGKVPRFDGTAASTNLLLRQGPWAQSRSYREISKDTLGSAVQGSVGQFQYDVRMVSNSLFMQMAAAVQGVDSVNAAQLATLAISAITLQPEPSQLPTTLPWVQADTEITSREAAPDTHLPDDANYIQDLADAIDDGKNIKGATAQLRKAPSLLAGLLAYSVDQQADKAAELFLHQTIKTRKPAAKTRKFGTPMTLGIDSRFEDEQSFAITHAGELSTIRLDRVTGDDSVTAHAVKQAAAVYKGNNITLTAWHEHAFSDLLQQWKIHSPRHTRDLASVRASLDALKGRTVGELDWALRTTLDVFDWRLDAWITSQATRRLASLRAGKDGDGEPVINNGIHVGAWGFVEDLKPDPAGNRESLGHMLMPSLRHAAAAAILRSGYLSNDPAARKAYDLDLSSQRVRAAKAVFEGLAQGQALAALLGYRFERGLRDGLLGAYIVTFRRKYPLRPYGLDSNGNADDSPSEAIDARDVVDGVALLEAGSKAVNTVPPGDRPTVQALVDDLTGLWDAVADLSIAEATYQIAQGNVDRAAAALSVLDKQTAPVESQVGDSPRDGATYTQRVALLLPTGGAAPAGWTDDAIAGAEPTLNAWLAQLIGDPMRFVLRGRVFVDDALQNDPIELDPSALGLSPLALMYALDAPGGARTDARVGAAGGGAAPDGSPSELSRLRLALAEAMSTLAVNAHGTQAYVHIEELPANSSERGLVHLEALLGLARRLIANARPAVRTDLAVIEGNFGSDNTEGDYPGVDHAELDARADSASTAFTGLADTLIAALPADDASPVNAAAIEAALAPLRPYNVLGVEREAHRSFPTQAAYDASVRERGRLAKGDIDARLAGITDQRATATAAGATPAAIVQAAIDTLKIVFGRQFVVVPRFTLGDAVGTVNASLAAQAALTRNDPVAVPGWLPKMAKVRDGVENLQGLLLGREMLVGRFADDCFGVLQSPAAENPVWAALPEAWPDAPGDDITTTDVLAGSRARPELAVAVHAPNGLPASLAVDAALAGLVCDDWAETVPSHTSTAAIAFHYDAPGARPPQSILLAVPPRRGMPNWTFDDVLATIDATIALARIRAVNPAQLTGSVNLALPMNVIPDSKAPTLPGLNIGLMVKDVYQTLNTTALGIVAKGKI